MLDCNFFFSLQTEEWMKSARFDITGGTESSSQLLTTTQPGVSSPARGPVAFPFLSNKWTVQQVHQFQQEDKNPAFLPGGCKQRAKYAVFFA